MRPDGSLHTEAARSLDFGLFRDRTTPAIPGWKRIAAPAWAGKPAEPAEKHEIPEQYRDPAPIQIKRGLWRTRGGDSAAVFGRYTETVRWPWFGDVIFTNSGPCRSAWTDQGLMGYDEQTSEFDLVAYIGPLPEDVDPAFAAIVKRTEEIVSTAEDRAAWLAAAEVKCARAAESRAQAEADRARRAALPVHDGNRLVPTEAPAAMVMLPGMGER